MVFQQWGGVVASLVESSLTAEQMNVVSYAFVCFVVQMSRYVSVVIVPVKSVVIRGSATGRSGLGE